jgi:xylulokinase
VGARARSLLVGIDLGTTVCKALVFDLELQLVSAASRHLALSTLSGTEIEQDAEGWWAAVQEVVREALQGPGCDARSVRGISVSSQGISFVPVDAAGAPLRPAFSWLDTRAIEQRRLLEERLGEEQIFEVTGKRCHEVYLLPKLLWFRENEPAAWKKCRRILMPLDFILSRLTGEYGTDHTMASGTMLYDITSQEWSARMLDAFNLDHEMLSPLSRGGTPIGALRAEAADSLGLPRGVIVSMGGQDQKVAALGAGIDLTRCTISLGTAMAITQKCERPVIDPRMRMPCFADLLPGRWVLEGSAVCCSILDWAKQVLFPGLDDETLNRMADEAADRPHGPLLLPFFSGASAPFHDPGARGTLHGLDLSTTPGQIVRSIYEGIAFLVRACIEVMEDISRPVEGLRIFGGGSRSDVWCGIIADAVRRPVSALATHESASVGAAILAGLGSGVFETLEDAFTRIAVRTSYEPRKQRADHYDGAYAEFQALSARLLRQDGHPADFR